MIGDEEINSFSDDSRVAKYCGLKYTNLKHSLLQTLPWRFSIRQASLARVTGQDPLYDYQFVHQLPTDTLRVITSDIGDNDFQVYRDKLFSNTKDVNIEYQFVPDDSEMPDYFKTVLEIRIAMFLAMAIRQDEGIYDRLNSLYNNEWNRAKVIDGQQNPTRRAGPENFSLATSRF